MDMVKFRPLRRRYFNRPFAVLYSAAISALLYRHLTTLFQLHPTAGGIHSFLISLTLLAADLVLAFLWFCSQAFRMKPTATALLPDNPIITCPETEFPALDVFICTADPYMESPMSVAATVLSVMAFDYPPEKLSFYVSDDGGSEVTLFALREAVEFGKAWLPFCRRNRVMERCPESFFGSGFETFPEAREIQDVYEDMKTRVENAVQAGGHWTKPGYTAQSHPTIIQVLSQSSEDKDDQGIPMPNLIYLSREKVSSYPHNFKAGASNVLIRVSSIMTNAPLILALDCDMISNDPLTPRRMLSYFLDAEFMHNLGYIQFPGCFHGINDGDIYGSTLKRVFYINALGMNGLRGPDCIGTGVFFNRRAFHGNPTKIIVPDMHELGVDYVVKKPISDEAILDLAHRVARYDYERQTRWGIEVGFLYGSLVEDFYTSYRLQCKGWRSMLYIPKRIAFMSEMPISITSVITQQKRWSVGNLQVGFSKYSPLTYGTKFLGPLMAPCYSYYAFGPLASFSIMVYTFLPQLTLLNNITIFPKAIIFIPTLPNGVLELIVFLFNVIIINPLLITILPTILIIIHINIWSLHQVSEPWFLVYTFLFLSSYGQDFVEFMLAPCEGTTRRWWNDQRIWLLKGLSCDLFGTLEFISNQLGISTIGFDVTNKVDGEGQRTRYNEGKFEFGDTSLMFVPLTTAAIVNGVAFCWGIVRGDWLNMSGQIAVAFFGAMNSLPVYEAMVVRRDGGKMPAKITFISTILACLLYMLTSYLV